MKTPTKKSKKLKKAQKTRLITVIKDIKYEDTQSDANSCPRGDGGGRMC